MWVFLGRRHLALKMLGSFSRSVPRLFGQPGSAILRRCFAAEAAVGRFGMALTFGSPTEVSGSKFRVVWWKRGVPARRVYKCSFKISPTVS